MKVALFVHCFFPEHFFGTETYTLQLARNLRDLGHEPTVIACVFQGEARRDAMITHGSHDGIPVVRLDKNFEPHRRIAETYWQDAMRPHLQAVLDELRPDIVHVTHLINHTAVLLDEAAATGYRLVATLTDFFGFCFNNRLEAADGSLCAGPSRTRLNCIECFVKARDEVRGVRRAMPVRRVLATAIAGTRVLGGPRRYAIPAADLVARPDVLLAAYRRYDAMIVPTTFLRDAYVRNGFPVERMHRSPFGVDIARPREGGRIRTGPVVLGFIGQIAPHKGVSLLLEALRSRPRGEFAVRIYGTLDESSSYARLLRALAGPETAFMGTYPATATADVMAGLDVLVIPSTWYENSPLVLLDALASHVPVVVSDVPGLTEFVDEGVNGWAFRRGDSADLARVLGRLASDPSLVSSAAAVTRYERTTRAMTEDVVEVYDRVLGEAAAP